MADICACVELGLDWPALEKLSCGRVVGKSITCPRCGKARPAPPHLCTCPLPEVDVNLTDLSDDPRGCRTCNGHIPPEVTLIPGMPRRDLPAPDPKPLNRAQRRRAESAKRRRPKRK